MKDYVLECCVDSAESALNAARGGAGRLELCGNLSIGGTTPDTALSEEIRKYSDIRIHALIRPRFGDFCYTDHELEIIRGSIRRYKELGAEGVVIGVLKPDGTLDMEEMKKLMKEAEGMSVTLHRAFDMCRDPRETLEQAVELGINTILTSGQQNNCVAGKELIRDMVEWADGRIDILVAGGVGAEVIRELRPFTKASSFHMSGKVTLDSKMEYRKSEVSMGLPSLSEYEIWQTDEKKIRAAKEVLDAID